VNQVRAARNNEGVTGPVCALLTQSFICASRFPRCTPSVSATFPTEDIPILPCDDYCTLYWDVCRNALELYGSNAVQGDFADSTLPNCLPTTSPTPRPGTFLGLNAQPPDLIGGRSFIGGAPKIRGLLGVLLYPNDYNYTYADGQTEPVQCWEPPSNLTAKLNLEVSCFDPYVVSAASVCALPCPFPLYDPAESGGIQGALIGPGIVGLILCLFVMLDSLWIIMETRGVVCNKWAKPQSKGQSSSGAVVDSNDSPATSRKQVRASTWYALVGGVLGIVYFLVGVLPTLLYGSSVSCAEPTIDPSLILNGQAPPDPTSCAVQRASPFILRKPLRVRETALTPTSPEALFNLILFAMVTVFFRIDDKIKSMQDAQKRLLDVLLWGYCVGVPIAALIAAFALDTLSKDLFVAASQLARQATMCQLRLLPTAVEVILVDLPFILTGLFCCIMSVLLLVKIVRISRKAAHGTTDMASASPGPQVRTFKLKSAADRSLHQLIQRLAFLGLSTFVVLIVFMSSTGLFQSQLDVYGPAFETFVSCQSQGFACLNCGQYKVEALAYKPSAGILATQLASMSSVIVLFGVFFGAQSLARLQKEYREGVLQKSVRRVFIGSERAVEVSTTPMSGDTVESKR
jgi:hypothetical protein